MAEKKKIKKVSLDKAATCWSIGGSIFSMFFGAGNIIFPLILGVLHPNHSLAASLGIIGTAVLVPFLGLVGIILYSGDYKNFFYEIGKIPGFILIVMILALIGPLAGIPRAITVSHATLNNLSAAPILGLPWFSLICCLLIFLFSWKLDKLLGWLGYFFTPVMLCSLAWVLIKGLLIAPNPPVSALSMSTGASFYEGSAVGFNTMDLIASFFFCSIVLTFLRQIASQEENVTPLESNTPIGKRTMWLLTKSSLIAIGLLAIVYLGFTTVAARHSGALQNVPSGEVLGALSKLTLGKNGFITGIGVFVACLTTEIALTGIFARFLQTIIFRKYNVSYHLMLVVTLIPSFAVSILNFDNICRFLGPLLGICYPAIIGLTVGNILHKTCNFRYPAILFYGVLSVSIFIKLFY